MLKSSQVLVAPGAAPGTSRGLRRVQSGSSLDIESPRKGTIPNYFPFPSTSGDKSAAAALHSRGVSVDVPRPKSRTGFTDHAKEGKGGAQKALSPVQFVSVLTGKSSLELEVDVVKKLCLLLRNEAAR